MTKREVLYATFLRLRSLISPRTGGIACCAVTPEPTVTTQGVSRSCELPNLLRICIGGAGGAKTVQSVARWLVRN